MARSLAPRRASLLLGAVMVLGACAHTPPRLRDPKTVEMDPIVFSVNKDGTVVVHDPADPFLEAAEHYKADRFAEALALFDRVAEEHKGSQHARSSLYNAGLCLEQLGRRPEAAQRFRVLADEYPDSPEALDALFRLGATLQALKDWGAVDEVEERILKRNGLTLSDRVECLARLGEARFERGKLDDAERTLHRMRELYREHETEERLDTDYFLAMGNFFLAEVSHAQYMVLPVRLPQKKLEEDLEAKARMLLLSQKRYVDAMRVKHPEWATAAAFRIGSLYREFYDDLVGAPVPESLTGEAREVYQEAVKKKVRNLLVKAVSFHEKNVLMAERTGEKNDWVRRSTAEIDELKRLLEPGIPAPRSGEASGPLPEPPRPVPPPHNPVAPTRDLGGTRTTM